MNVGKLSLLAAVAFAGLASSALAADMPVKAARSAPVVMQPSWTGFYIGAGAGYGMYDYDSSVSTTAGAFVSNSGRAGGRGWFGTVQVGGDYQFADRWVVGIFADYDFSDIKGTNLDTTFGLIPVKQNSAWAVGGRVGYLVVPQLLTYFSGGYASADFHAGASTSPTTGLATGFGRQNATFDGYFIGSGLEYQLAFLPGLSVKTEYRVADYGAENVGHFVVATGAAVPFQAHVTPYVQTVRTELVYKFNWR